MRSVSWGLVFLAGLVVPAANAYADDSRPNIVILYADDMGYGDLAIQNPDSKIPTPHLDQLARDGMRFTDGHSSSGICTPSRYALLTGRYHWRKFHGIVQSWDDSSFAPERTTLPEMLQACGYRTACIGKWHLGWRWSDVLKPGATPIRVGRNKTYRAEDFDWTKSIGNGPLEHGFDYYFGDDVPNFPPYTWIENDRVLQVPSVPYEPNPVPEEGAAEGRPGPMVEGWRQDLVMPTLTDRAVRWIGEQAALSISGEGSEPFFLYFPWTSPHAPIVPHEDFQGSTDAGPYGDFVHQSDATAGAVLDALDRHGFRDNTLVIFTADNGPEKYAYPRIRNYDHRSMGELRGLKRDIWEGGHRVPFVVRWPGKVPPASVNTGLVSQIDLMATIAAIVQTDLPDGTAEDSYDQSRSWFGGQESPRKVLVHNTKQNHYAIRSNNWLLLDSPSGTITAVPAWFDEQNGYEKNAASNGLYDLQSDLSQHENVAAKNPELVQQLQNELSRLRKVGQVRSLR